MNSDDRGTLLIICIFFVLMTSIALSTHRAEQGQRLHCIEVTKSPELCK